MVDSIVTMAAAVKALDKKKGKNLQVLQIVKVPLLLEEHMDDHIGKVQQHPAAVPEALLVVELAASLLYGCLLYTSSEA